MQAPAPQALPDTQHAMSEERLASPAAAPVEAAVHAVATELPVPVAAAEPAFVTEAVVHAEPAPAPTPVDSEPTPPPAPSVNVEKALQESGLVMIQTDPSKVKPAEPVAEPRFVPPRPRPRRVPPPDTGPLQIVETRKDA